MNAALEVVQFVISEVFRMSLQGSLLIILVLLAAAVARGWITPRGRYLLCCVAMVRLLLPLLPQTPTSLFNLVPWESAETEPSVVAGVATNQWEDELRELVVSPQQTDVPYNDISSIETYVDSSPSKPHDSAAAPSVFSESVVVTNPESSTASTPFVISVSPFLFAGFVWCIGVGVVLTRTVSQLLYDRRLLRRCLPVSIELTCWATAIAQQMKMRHQICLLASPDQAGPAATGFFRPKVVLPSRLLQSLPAEQLELVLRHELTHIQRGDILIYWLMTLIRVIHWFNPVVRVGLNTMQRDCELACDQSVLQQLSPQRRNEYGHTLLAVVENSLSVLSTPLLIGMTKDSRHLQRRIEMISEFRPSARGHRIVAFLAVCLLGICGLTDAVQPLLVNTTQDAATKPSPANHNSIALQYSELGGVRFVDSSGERIPGVKVRVYRFEMAHITNNSAPELIQETESNDAGLAKIRVKPFTSGSIGANPEVLLVVGQKETYSDVVEFLIPEYHRIPWCQMTKETGSLRGQVTDEDGTPISGVTVSLPIQHEFRLTQFIGPIPDVYSAITDENGRYEIRNLACWKSGDRDTFFEATRSGRLRRSVQFSHPKYPTRLGIHTGIPEELNYQLERDSVVEGVVRDEVTGRPVSGALVYAQSNSIDGIDCAHVWSTSDGSYRFLLLEDSYNIWARSPDRVAIAIASLETKAGKRTKAPDIRMVQGAIVRGTLRSSGDGPPIGSTGKTLFHVAHQGPARPRSGAAAESSLVIGNGTYELRVAPGDNYIFLKHIGDDSAITLHTEDGRSYDLDFNGSQPVPKNEAVDARRPNGKAPIRRPRAAYKASLASAPD